MGTPLGLRLGSSCALESLNPDYCRNYLPKICPCNMPAAKVIFQGKMGEKKVYREKKVKVF